MAKRTVKATKAPALLKEQPPASEFTKLARKAIVWLSLSEADEKGNIKDEKGVESSIEVLFQACDRLDASEVSHKDLLSSIKELSKVSWMIGNRITLAGSLPQQIDQIKVRAVEAIAKYTEGEGAENGETKS